MGMKVVIPYTPREVFKPIHRELERHRFNCLVAHRRLGKTVGLLNHMVREAIKCTKRNPQYVFVAPLRNQAKLIAWRYLKEFTGVFPDFKANETELYVEFCRTGNGTRRIYLCGADNPDALRGAYWDGVILDEYAQMNPDMWEEIILPSITDREGWVVFSGTPKGMNHFYDTYQVARKEYESNKCGDWWAGMYNVFSSGVFTAEQIKTIRKTMTDTKFRQEFLCDFSASNDDILIPIDLLQASVGKRLDYEAYSHSAIVLGVDVARFGDDSSVLFPRQGLQAFDPIKISKVDNMTLASRIYNMSERYNVQTIFIDSGRGEGVIDRLRQLGLTNVVEVNFGGSPPGHGYYNMRAYMWDNIRKWLERGGALPNNPDILTDLATPTYSINQQEKMVLESKEDIKKRLGHSTDYGDALALTFAYEVKSPFMLQAMQKIKGRDYNKATTFDPIKMGFRGRDNS